MQRVRRAILTEAAADGSLTTLVDHPLAELPAVRGRDILAAWEAATEAARNARRGQKRFFRFRTKEGGWTRLELRDADAACWAGAVDRSHGIDTVYGLAVFLRLLALIDLLAAARLAVPRGPVEVPPALLRLAAEARLTDDMALDGGPSARPIAASTTPPGAHPP